jgi:2-C-methyl-D-erythritol 4-phosphate cytidylyltransferase
MLPQNLKSYVIIVAGGSGIRMGAILPKQFLLLNGQPVLMYTMEAFQQSETQPDIILVLPADYHHYWDELCKTHNFNIPHHVVSGGETRFKSVKNGLDVIADTEEALVAVHDAVRPLASPEVIDKSYHYAAEYGNAIVAVKSRDSVRQQKDGISAALLRDEIYLIQTPQTFRLSQIKKAYLLPYHEKFTDDASVVEDAGHKINLIEGSYQNIKITYPEDIAIAELLLRGL